MNLVPNSFPRARVARNALVAAAKRIKEASETAEDEIKTSRKTYECKYCKFEKSSSIYCHYVHLRSHRFQTISTARYRCRKCKFYFTSPGWLRLHQSAKKKELLKKLRKRWKITFLRDFSYDQEQQQSPAEFNGFVLKRKMRSTKCGECDYDGPELQFHLGSVHGLCPPFRCNRCNFRCKYYHQYRYHKTMAHKGPNGDRRRAGRASTRCGECDEYNGPDLYEHLEQVHGLSKPFICPVCNYEAKFYSFYKQHKKTHEASSWDGRRTRTVSGRCGECDDFDGPELYEHLEQVHGLTTPFRCTLCSWSHKFYSRYKLHKKAHEGGGEVDESEVSGKFPKGYHQRGTKCDECDDYDGPDLYGHLAEVHGLSKPFKCPHCPEKMKFYSLYKQHKRSHIPRVVSGRCGECDEFNGPYLYEHLESVHSLKSPFECSLCGWSHKFYSRYKIHKKSHELGDGDDDDDVEGEDGTPRRSFFNRQGLTKCDECEDYDGPDLTGHLETAHGMTKPYKCSQCDFEHNAYSQYKVHKKCRHTGKGNYRGLTKCQECDDYEGPDLPGHLESAHGMTRPYKCPDCDFTNKFYSHYRVHRKNAHVKKCGECDDYEGADLAGHLESVHGMTPPFNCSSCDSTFDRYTRYRIHMSKAHRSERHKGGIGMAVCDECNYSGPFLADHLQSEHNLRSPFQCSLCDFSHKFYSAYKQHKRKHQEKQNSGGMNGDSRARGRTATKCYECEDYDGPELMQHLQQAHGLTLPFQCDTCDFSTGFYWFFRKHRMSHKRRGRQVTLCRECGYNGTDLMDHLLAIHGMTRPFHCSHCDFRTQFYTNFINHRKAHGTSNMGRKAIICGECADYEGPELTEHLKTAHNMVPPYSCSKCPFKSKFYAKYKLHKKAHDKGEEQQMGRKVTKCGECDDYMGPELETHLKIVHQLTPPFTCPLCSFKTKFYAKYKLHKKTHRRRRSVIQRPSAIGRINGSSTPRTCEECGFVGPDLYSHLAQVHGLTSPFKCSLCTYSNRFYSQFKQHRTKAHLSSGNCVCPICNSRFATNHGLGRHMRSHIARFVCPICETAYRQFDKFSSHVESHGNTQGEPLRCHLCDQYYPNTPTFLEHVSEEHDEYSSKTVVPKATSTKVPGRGRGRPPKNRHLNHSQVAHQMMNGQQDGGPYSPEIPWTENESMMDISSLVKVEVETYNNLHNNFYQNEMDDEGENEAEEEEEEIIACQYCGRIFYNEHSYLIHSTRHRVLQVSLNRAFRFEEHPIYQ